MNALTAPGRPGAALKPAVSPWRLLTGARWVQQFRARLRDRRFWAVQVLVLVVTAVHWGLELVSDLVGRNFGGLYVVVLYSIYLVPIIYASLNFGREGAIPTALWSALLALPNIVFDHRGTGQIVEAIQLSTMIALGVVIAGRVDREIAARRDAENEGLARRLSEAKYRRLFDSAGEAILVIDRAGVVQEANVAAAALFGRPLELLRGADVADLLGADGAQIRARLVEAGERTTGDLLLRRSDGQSWVEFVCSSLQDPAGNGLVQAIFRDVTERRERQRRLESYAREMLRAQEDERRRIAREIHDDFLQSVVLLCRRLDTLDEDSRVGPAPCQAVSAGLRETRQRAESLADDLRRFSRDLRPTILDDLGLVPALRRLLNDVEDGAGLHGRFAATGIQRRLSTEIELCLFRIAQEALRNVERHASASRATVTLAYEDTCVRLTVADDGVGFAASGAGRRRATDGKLGLLGMQERARLVGGDFAVESSPGRGTRVRVSVPVEQFRVDAVVAPSVS